MDSSILVNDYQRNTEQT